MKRLTLLLIFFGILFSGCSAQEPIAPPTESSIPIVELVAEAIIATQAAEVENFSPEFPYSPAQLATLLEPGADLEGRWTPSTVTDITQPIPGYACSGYYGSCWGDWAKDISYGAQLLLLLDEDQLGEIDFMYFDDLADVENAYQLFLSKWYSRETTTINPYDRDPIGEQWLHRAKYYEIVEEDSSWLKEPRDLDVLEVEIVFSRCHGFVSFYLWFPTQTPWSSSENPSAERLAEKEALFNLAYAYARSIDGRITPYACNEK